MQSKLIQHHYDEVIAPRYDLDPQSVLNDSLVRAVAQVHEQQPAEASRATLKVLDLGIGTGRFLEKLKTQLGCPVQPFGIDLSEKMIDVARARIPELVAIVDDAAKLEVHFPPEMFDLVCTHFVTGFVPVSLLAPKIWSRLAEGGYWSFVGGTREGFPELQQKANARFIRWLFGGKTLDVGQYVCNPADRADVIRTLEGHGFAVRACETYQPELHFAGLSDFLDFAYHGGWLTPFIEAWGLHRAGLLVRLLLNTFVFPVKDHHSIEIVLAQKAAQRSRVRS